MARLNLTTGICLLFVAGCGGSGADGIVGIWQSGGERIEFLPGGTLMTNIQMASSGTWTRASGNDRFAVTLTVALGGPVSMPACLSRDTLVINGPKGPGYYGRVKSDGSVTTPDVAVTCA